jgi:flagellin
VTASESVIRDADMAVEVSALTRAQILVQSTQSTLQLANSVPRQVLALLG